MASSTETPSRTPEHSQGESSRACSPTADVDIQPVEIGGINRIIEWMRGCRNACYSCSPERRQVVDQYIVGIAAAFLWIGILAAWVTLRTETNQGRKIAGIVSGSFIAAGLIGAVVLRCLRARPQP